MQVIYTCLVIVMFIAGTIFGYCIGKNGAVVIGSGTGSAKADEQQKKSVEQQLEEMMSYDGKIRKDK